MPKLLATYLQDHHAGATAGLELARRAAGSNEDTAYGDELEAIAEEIAEDKDALERVMDGLAVSPHFLKDRGAWVLEKLGRLKPNGHWLSYSPLSRVVELEGLIAGVTAKRALWESLRTTFGESVEGESLEELSARARDQSTRLEALHDRAAAEAFGGGGASA